jgi:RNA 2',3'-cyclic 3'-phosphodiesterase
VPALVRTWVGLWPPGNVLDVLEELPRPDEPGVRWTTRAQWHVTLRFLGTVDPDQVVDVLSGLRHPRTSAVLGPRVGRLGRNTLVLPVAGLDALAVEVGSLLDVLGLPPATPFLGHLTLARLKGAPACGLVDQPVSVSWVAGSVAVVTSELHPDGVRYTTVAEIPLDGPQ